jgi:hypothetical protein
VQLNQQNIPETSQTRIIKNRRHRHTCSCRIQTFNNRRISRALQRRHLHGLIFLHFPCLHFLPGNCYTLPIETIQLTSYHLTSITYHKKTPIQHKPSTPRKRHQIAMQRYDLRLQLQATLGRKWMNKKRKQIQIPSKTVKKKRQTHRNRNCDGERVWGGAEEHCGGSFSMGNAESILGVHFSRYPPKYSITRVLH